MSRHSELMSRYSEVHGGFTYDFVNDETVEQILSFLYGDGIINGLNEIFDARGSNRNHTYSIFNEYPEVDNNEIFIDTMIDVRHYDIKEELTVIFKFLNDIGVTDVDVDFSRKGKKGGYKDIEHFKNDDNGKIVSSMAKLTYRNYKEDIMDSYSHRYRDVSGTISYDFIEDETIDQIKTFLDGSSITKLINEERGVNQPFVSSLFEDFSRVNAYDIFIDCARENTELLKEEITVIVKFLNDIGVTGITVDIYRENHNNPDDKEHYKLDANGNVVSARSKIVYEDYS